MNQEKIELFDSKARCPECGYEFTATLILEDIGQEAAEVKCPGCSSEYFVMVRDELKSEFAQRHMWQTHYERQARGARAHFESNLARYYERFGATYCGKCGKKTTQPGYCVRCGIDLKKYSEASPIVPNSIRYQQYLAIVIGIAAIFLLALEASEPYPSCFTPFLMVMFSIAYYLILFGISERISRYGVINCQKCTNPISPMSVFCIYCGKKVFGAISKRDKITIAVVLFIPIILALSLVAFAPPDVEIAEVSYVDPEDGDTDLVIVVTLTNDLRKTALEEKIVMVFKVVGLEQEFRWHGGYINYQEEISDTFTIALPEQSGNSVLVDIEVYYINENVFTGEKVRNLHDSGSILVNYR